MVQYVTAVIFPTLRIKGGQIICLGRSCNVSVLVMGHFHSLLCILTFSIVGTNCCYIVWFHILTPMKGHWKFQGDRGLKWQNFLKEVVIKLKWNFLRGGGGGLKQNTFRNKYILEQLSKMLCRTELKLKKIKVSRNEFRWLVRLSAKEGKKKQLLNKVYVIQNTLILSYNTRVQDSSK